MITPRIPSLSLSLLILLASLSLLHLKPSLFSSPHNQPLTLAEKSETFVSPNHQELQITRKNYIVRFREYKRAEDHRHYLESRLKFGGWEWIERRNPAAKFPTDFGVVTIEGSIREVLIGEFEKLELVKDVWADSSYHRGLFGEKTKGFGKVGAFVDVKKRPGKIFTAMSFSEGHENCAAATSNASISWKRHLLMQVNCVLCCSSVLITLV